MNPEQLEDVVDTLRTAYAAKLIRGEHPAGIWVSHSTFEHTFYVHGMNMSLGHGMDFRTRFVVVRGDPTKLDSSRSGGVLEPDALGREAFGSVVAEFVHRLSGSGS
jgi:hypothetical protein